MKEQIKAEDIQQFNRDGRIYAALMIGMMVSFIPLIRFLGWVGLGLWILWVGVTAWWSFRVEKQKKKYDIHTYKEIVAFTEGKRLDELQKNQEIGKRPYQGFLLGIGTGVVTFLVCLLLDWILK